MTVRILGPSDRDAYDTFAAASPVADVLNSWAWGEVKRSSGWTPRRLALTDERGAITAAAQILETRPVRGAPPIWYCPRGPVLDYRDAESLGHLLDEIRSRSGSAILLKCDPAIERGSPEADTMRASGLRPAGSGAFGGVQPTAVMTLDLAPGPDKLLEGFHHKWRYNIRVAERKGVTVTQGTREDIPAFYELLLHTAKRDGFVVRGRDYFETLHDVLTPSGQFALFMTQYEGTLVAGAIMLCFGPRATYTYGASSSEHRNVMPNHLMQWTMIRWAHEHGFQIYDFRGVSPVRDGVAVEPHIAGLNRFKEGFGARYVEYAGEHDLPLRPILYRGWVHGAPLAMKALKKLRGRGGDAE